MPPTYLRSGVCVALVVAEALVAQAVRPHAAAVVVPRRHVAHAGVTRRHAAPVALPTRLCYHDNTVSNPSEIFRVLCI